MHPSLPEPDFHAHVYFDLSESDRAAALRATIARTFGFPVGHLHQATVGPHGKPMFQVSFNAADHAAFTAWLERHRAGLSVLIHPNSVSPVRDHSTSAAWIGTPVAIDLSVFDDERG